MDQLSYHTKLRAHKTIANKDQINLIQELFKTGFATEETLNLFKVLISTIELTQIQKVFFLNLTNQYIFEENTQKDIINILNNTTQSLLTSNANIK